MAGHQRVRRKRSQNVYFPSLAAECSLTVVLLYTWLQLLPGLPLLELQLLLHFDKSALPQYFTVLGRVW